MTKTNIQKIKKTAWIRIVYGQDLYQALNSYCLKNKIKNGIFLAIGTLQKAIFSFYNQKERKYLKKRINKQVEIIFCIGNISLKDRQSFLHAHISIAGQDGKCFGGHLEKGCIIFACECLIIEFKGQLLSRNYDSLTGLNLWSFN